MNNRSLVGRDVKFEEYSYATGRWLVCVAEVVAVQAIGCDVWTALIERVDGTLESVSPMQLTVVSGDEPERLAKLERKRKAAFVRGHKRRVSP